MADLSRVANNVCIYWTVPEVYNGNPGSCYAIRYFAESRISCYNGGKCNGAGTCRECTAYDVGGLKVAHKDTKQIYTSQYLQVWNEDQAKYLTVRHLTEDEATDIGAFSRTMSQGESVVSTNYSGLQTPINLAIYNLRAAFKKCCNWRIQPAIFEKTKYGVLYVTVYDGTSKATFPYLSKNQEGEYINAPILSNFCLVKQQASPWLLPLTSENPTVYGCNGCKPECPYYTGPKWSYCIDSKMDNGDRVSASQIMELRYYSDDWASMENPKVEWNKRFKYPDIWAWSGTFEGVDMGATISINDRPMVKRVYINTFTSKEPIINISPPVPADVGLVVTSFVDDEIVPTSSYPTLVSELTGIRSNLEIVWPKTTATDPYVFKTFREDQAVSRVFVRTPYASTVVAINCSKHPQGSDTDKDFLNYMRTSYPEDIISSSSAGVNDILYFDVPLEFDPPINMIRVYTLDLSSELSEYLTATCFIKHKFYHAMIAQTKGTDFSGHRGIQPWFDKFEHVECEAKLMKLSNYPEVHDILWDTHAGGKLTTYQVEEVIQDELQENWSPLYCNLAVITFSDTRCNSVTPWKIEDTSVYGVPLGVYLDRTDNPRATDGVVLLEVYYKSSNGQYLQGNVVVVGPQRGTALSSSLDPTRDKLYATYAVTEYKQGPVLPSDIPKLKYPALKDSYINEMPLDIVYNEGPDTFSVTGNFLRINIVSQEGTVQSSGRIFSLDSYKDFIHRALSTQEAVSFYSLKAGGMNDSSVETSGSIFSRATQELSGTYGSAVFASDGAAVSLSEICSRLSDIGTHEGSYTFTVIFNDEEGRPIGVKRSSMLLQSSIAETRDVEIKYEWTMPARDLPIIDTLLLLARFNEPVIPLAPVGDVVYSPKCGDHSENMGMNHFFGEPGPMWYPYSRCLEPRYDLADSTDVVKCRNFVEGFGPSYVGKRWSYWERMRGPDKFYTWNGGPIYLLGCFYRDYSYTYETVGEQAFTGYTRVRSTHTNGPYAKDREALHVNRHYVKRNLKVRDEIIQHADDENAIVWTDKYSQYMFTDAGVERVGDSSESALWVHISDNASEVELTPEDVQHPFTHYLLGSVGSYNYSEQYQDLTRLSLSELFIDRDLTSTQLRNPVTGALIYKPGEPIYVGGMEKYDDIVPVFSASDIAWAWMELEKAPVRGTPRVTGVSVYNPSSNAWKQDKSSAVHSSEGTHYLDYSPPVFNDQGVITTSPGVSWAGGPYRILNWYTGRWSDTGTVYDYAQHTNVGNFAMFGEDSTSTSSSFLIDPAGLQKVILNNDNDGTVYGHTYRGVGVNSLVSIHELPYTLVNYLEENIEVSKKVIILNSRFKSYATNTMVIPLGGFYYVENLEITYTFGPSTDEQDKPIRFDIPDVLVSAAILITEDGVNPSNKVVDVASRGYQRTTTGTVLEGVAEDGVIYTYNSVSSKKVNYAVGMRCDHIVVKYGSLESDGQAFVSDFRLWYRKPVETSEPVYVYERKFNVSKGNNGTPDYRQMLYYYNRTYSDFGDDLSYTVSSDYSQPTVKLTNRSVKDVILEYEFVDPTYTRFAYKTEIRPENNTLTSVDEDGARTIPGAISVCTKGRTLIAGTHKNDCPQYTSVGFNTYATAINETSSCALTTGSKKLNEGAQECLYNEAGALLGDGDVETIYGWFWHPDEVDFWTNTVGISLETFYPTLTLTSKVASFNKVWEHESFGCTSDLSTPYFDGYVHPLGKWQAMGHILEVVDPLFNEACWDVVVSKEGRHLGEKTYGTDSYGSFVGASRWPYESYKDMGYYISAGLIMSKSSYEGGIIGGSFTSAAIASSVPTYSMAQQRILAPEINEGVYGGRARSIRADASRRGFHDEG